MRRYKSESSTVIFTTFTVKRKGKRYRMARRLSYSVEGYSFNNRAIFEFRGFDTQIRCLSVLIVHICIV